MKYQNVKNAIKALQKGELILVMDDKDRENEGDLICSAKHATTENVNFMATYAKGLICIPISSEIADRLNFSSPSAFHNFFKRITGLTPKEYQTKME